MKNLAYIVVEDKIMDKKKVEMSVEENIDEMKKSLKNLEESDCYDVGKYTYSLLHQTRQLEYFYCQLLEQEEATPDQTFYHVLCFKGLWIEDACYSLYFNKRRLTRSKLL